MEVNRIFHRSDRMPPPKPFSSLSEARSGFVGVWEEVRPEDPEKLLNPAKCSESLRKTSLKTREDSMWSNQVEVEAAAELEAMASAHGFQPDEPEAGLLYLCLCSIEVCKGRGWTYFFGSGVFFDAGVDVSEPYIRDFWYHVLQCLLLQDSDVQPSLLTLYFW